MSKFFCLSRKKRGSKTKCKKIIPAMRANLKIINTILAVLVVVVAVSYFVQINSLATKGYQITELEDKVEQLEQEKKDLELISLNLQSMGTVKEKVDGLGLVAINDVQYLTPTPVAVAR